MPRFQVRKLPLAFGFGIGIIIIFFKLNSLSSRAILHFNVKQSSFDKQNTQHPIEYLMSNAEIEGEFLIKRQSKTLEEAVSQYKARYKRQPPPDFDVWFDYAKSKDCLIIDDYDQIYKDLDPFWGIPPAEIRKAYASMANVRESMVEIRIRENEVTKSNGHFKGDAMIKLIEPFAKYLPEMNIIVNQQDEPRVVAGYEEVSKALENAKINLEENLKKAKSNTFSQLKEDEFDTVEKLKYKDLTDKCIYDFYRRACPPDSEVANSQLPQIYSDIPVNSEYQSTYATSFGHFIFDPQAQRELCTQPDLRNLNSALVRPNTQIFIEKLVPIFSECKLSPGNDIIFPATLYHLNWANYMYKAKEDFAWDEKKEDAYWIGTSNGGPLLSSTLRVMQRSRFVLQMNHTVARQSKILLKVSDQDEDAQYVEKTVDISKFLEKNVDVAFNELRYCHDECDYIKTLFDEVPSKDFSENWNHKYLIDIDGHSHSARFRAFLLSNSVPIKQTLYVEWHDQRLVPWLHYIPLDQRYLELDSILTYFMGYNTPVGKVERHDEKGSKIAKKGREWAKKVHRRQDMEVYMFRLLLEYARVIDDNRNEMGFDIKKRKKQ